MNKEALIADLHFGARKNSEIILQSQKKFFYEQFFPYLKEHNIEKIRILGDIFESRTSIDVKIENEVLEFFKQPFKFDVIIGNHDLYYNNDSSMSSLKMLEKYNNVNIINEQYIDSDTGFVSIPWIQDKDKFLSSLNNIKADICFGHFDINSFVMVGNHISKNWLLPEHLKVFKKVFTGHFHKKSSIKYENTIITYLGNPYHVDRNDIGQEKGFYIFDKDTFEIEFIENTKSSKFIVVNYPDKIAAESVNNNFIDVHVKEDDVNLNEKEFYKYLSEINSYNPAKNASVIIEKNKDYLDNDVEIPTESKSIMDLITDFVNVQETILNKESLISKLEYIYQECLEE